MVNNMIVTVACRFIFSVTVDRRFALSVWATLPTNINTIIPQLTVMGKIGITHTNQAAKKAYTLTSNGAGSKKSSESQEHRCSLMKYRCSAPYQYGLSSE